VSEDRLDRIENKLDKLTEVVAAMVRLEEKLASHQGGMERFGFRLDDIEERVEQIEKRVPVYNLWVGWMNKVALVVVSALVLAVLGLVLA